MDTPKEIQLFKARKDLSRTSKLTAWSGLDDKNDVRKGITCDTDFVNSAKTKFLQNDFVRWF